MTYTSQGNDNTTGCLLDYPYFKKHKKSKINYLEIFQGTVRVW